MSKLDKKAGHGSSYVTIGFEFTATVAAFGYLGWWLDGKFGTFPLLMILIGLMAFTGSVYKMWYIGQKMIRQDKAEKLSASSEDKSDHS